MAKQQTFADKALKATLVKGVKCDVCGGVYQPILFVASERSKVTGSWKFSERRIQVCKCNEKRIYS